jgi:hypothetical protein
MLHNFSFLRRFVLLNKVVALLLFILVGCSDDAEEIVRPQQNSLDARAGDDQNVLIGSEVILDASASRDENGTPFDYKWVLKYKPAGSTAAIGNATSPQSMFTPDKVGIYTVVLTIKQGEYTDSDEMHVIVTATDDPEEPQTILIDSDITEERILQDIFTDGNTPDYIVMGDIRVTANLTVQPGVVIEFEQDKSLQVMFGGALIAEGTETQSITFTGTQKQPGYWKGLLFASNSVNTLRDVIIEYGGSSEFPESPRANISVPGDAFSGSVLRISNSAVSNSGNYGIYVGGMSSVPEFVDMTFAGNAGTAIYCSPKNVSHMDPNTVFSGNGFNGVETGGILDERILVSWYPLSNGAYRITSDLTIASKLEIVPGVVFKMSKDVLITIAPGGLLSANGTADETIVFEGTSTASENAWRGIVLSSGEENSIDHAILRNMTSARASIGVAAGGKLTITNSLVEKNAGWGIALEGGSLYNDDIQTGNIFLATALGSVRFPEQPQPVDIAGEWVDYASVISNRTIDENFYDRQTGEWFGGADHPWVTSPQTAFGLKIDESGNYVWIIAEQHSPMTECFTYSAEHFTGHLTADGEFLNFVEESWRSKYFNSCSPEESMDMEVQPGRMQLSYQITKEYNPVSGNEYQVLTITSGGGSFKLYKR